MFQHIFIIFVIFNVAAPETTPCKLRATEFGTVCVCTANYCDYLENPEPKNGQIVAVSSSKAGLRFSATVGNFDENKKFQIKDFDGSIENFSTSKTVNDDTANSELDHVQPIQINVDREERFQKIVGFGGGFTGAISYILQHLSTDLQDHAYKSFYHEAGIGYNILRTPIGGCDFDLAPWAYNEVPIDDVNLSNFTKLDERDEVKVEQIKRLKEVANIDELKIMASAWSPPKWMKTNNEWFGFSLLKTEYYQTWADYHLKFLELWASKNLPIWAITTGNEPLSAIAETTSVRFMCLGWTPKLQAIWLNDNLGPTIRNSKQKDVLIFSNDEQRITYPMWFEEMKSARSNVLDYLDGLSTHWYYDDSFSTNLIEMTHNKMPDKLLLNTESCIGPKPGTTHGPEIGSWDRAEEYLVGFLQNIQHQYNGMIDWNILLNENGGPNYVENHVDAPVLVNMTNQQEFYKQPIYYAIGHFSKFIKAGSVRINTEFSDLTIDAVGFQRPDDSIALLVFNSGKNSVDITLNDSHQGILNINIPARSVHTFLYN